MAPTIRLTGGSGAARLALVGVGDFADPVLETLAAAWPQSVRVAPTDVDTAVAGGAAATVVALWRPSPGLCADIDATSFRHGRPWLPIISEHPNIVVGPWVDPAAGACFHCYTRRRVQHELANSQTSTLHDAYDRDPVLGPVGYLPHHARVAAGLADVVLRQAFTEVDRTGHAAPAGRVTAYNVVTGVLTSHRVVGCHGCERCGPAQPASGLADLVHRLSPAVAGAGHAR